MAALCIQLGKAQYMDADVKKGQLTDQKFTSIRETSIQ
jgi:hypothetical protein